LGGEDIVRKAAGSSTGESYDTTSIVFHWLTFFMVLAMFLLVLVPGVVKGSVELHKTIGISILIVAVLRAAWRLAKGAKPRNAEGVPLLLHAGAKAAHIALYALLIVTPILGWLYVDAKGIEVHFLGIELPTLNYYNRELAMQIYGLKKLVAYGLLALIFMHAGAAIVYHHILRGDGVLRSMLPRSLKDRLAA
jgi:superoxide oxidase